MNRVRIQPDREAIPRQFHSFLDGADIYDSSCSPTAKVLFLDKGPGFYLKSAPKGTLRREAEMTRFFHSKGLGAEVLGYESLDKDWMLTVRVPGEDCLDPMYLADPIRLCDTMAELLRMLHDTDPTGCPVPDRTGECLATARRNYLVKTYGTEHFPDNWGYATAEEAWRIVEENGKYLKSDTLIHGDYCLPNILLDNWCFSGFIDLDAGGMGDLHEDLFWATWSLGFNLKTDRYRDRFLDAYGRERICDDIFPVIAAIAVFD